MLAALGESGGGAGVLLLRWRAWGDDGDDGDEGGGTWESV